jgi:hypothetical protein
MVMIVWYLAFHLSVQSVTNVLDETCDQVCQWFVTGRWFSPGTPVSSTNKTDRHDIIEILLNVALNTTTLTINETLTLTNKTVWSKDESNIVFYAEITAYGTYGFIFNSCKMWSDI